MPPIHPLSPIFNSQEGVSHEERPSLVPPVCPFTLIANPLENLPLIEESRNAVAAMHMTPNADAPLPFEYPQSPLMEREEMDWVSDDAIESVPSGIHQVEGINEAVVPDGITLDSVQDRIFPLYTSTDLGSLNFRTVDVGFPSQALAPLFVEHGRFFRLFGGKGKGRCMVPVLDVEQLESFLNAE